jgi:hypothetical protein
MVSHAVHRGEKKPRFWFDEGQGLIYIHVQEGVIFKEPHEEIQ